MKKNLIWGAIITAFLLFFTPPSQALKIGFDPIEQMPGVAESVSVDLFISGLGDFSAPSLGAFDLDISFDPNILSIGDVDFDLLLGDPDWFEASTEVLYPGDLRPDSSIVPDGTVNLIEVSFFTPIELDDSQPSTFTLASLTFETLAIGTSPLDLTINSLGDGFGFPLDAEVQSGSISPVAEPATILLMFSGMAGLGVFGRKRFKR